MQEAFNLSTCLPKQRYKMYSKYNLQFNPYAFTIVLHSNICLLIFNFTMRCIHCSITHGFLYGSKDVFCAINGLKYAVFYVFRKALFALRPFRLLLLYYNNNSGLENQLRIRCSLPLTEPLETVSYRA